MATGQWKINNRHRKSHPYALIDHTADVGIRVFGKTLDDLFAFATLALFDLLAGPPAAGAFHSRRQVSVSGLDWPDLMVNWLREMLFFWTDSRYLLRGIKTLSLAPYTLSASVDLARFDPETNAVNHDIKAVTYHDIDVYPVTGGWESRIIFDV